MKHKVLILGTLGEFTELVKKAKEKGYETVVCDGYADGIARTYADKAYTIPVTDVDAIALMCREEGVDGIITSFSDLLLECMVKIADKAGLPCYLKPEQLSWYRDKSACRDVLDKLGLPAPGFRKISVELLKQGSEEEIQQSIANLQMGQHMEPCGQRQTKSDSGYVSVRKFWLRNTMTVMSLT